MISPQKDDWIYSAVDQALRSHPTLTRDQFEELYFTIKFHYDENQSRNLISDYRNEVGVAQSVLNNVPMPDFDWSGDSGLLATMSRAFLNIYDVHMMTMRWHSRRITPVQLEAALSWANHVASQRTDDGAMMTLLLTHFYGLSDELDHLSNP
jgi:hypothetical protein